MIRYVARRLLGVVPTLLLLVLLTVVLTRLMPGDVIDQLLLERAADDNARQQLESLLGLDKSLPVQYVDYIKDAMRGDLGESLIEHRPVLRMIGERVNISIELASFSLIVAWSFGATVGTLSAMYQNRPLDYLLRAVAVLGLTVPTFALGVAVVLLPAIWWRWSPPLSYVSFTENPVAHLKQFILPALVLGFATAGSIMRLTRTTMLEVLRQDYVRTAHAKGLRGIVVVTRHAVRNALVPVLSVFGLQVASLLSGAVIIESIFALPGMGRLMLGAVEGRDYPVIQGVTLMVGVFVMLVNLLVDLSYPFIDPRIKAAGKAL